MRERRQHKVVETALVKTKIKVVMQMEGSEKEQPIRIMKQVMQMQMRRAWWAVLVRHLPTPSKAPILPSQKMNDAKC